MKKVIGVLVAAALGLVAAPQLAHAGYEECDELALAADDIEEFKNWLDAQEEVQIDAKTLKEMRASAKELKKVGGKMAKSKKATKSEKKLGQNLADSAGNLDQSLAGSDLDAVITAYELVVDDLDDLTVACDQSH